MRFLLLLSFLGLFSGCSNVDRFVFKNYGKLIFASSDIVSIKEVHIDSENFEGKGLILEGMVSLVGPYGTYAVLSDMTSQILINQTNIARAGDKILNSDIGSRIRVYGDVVIKTRGLPTVKASTVSRVTGAK
jgi:hypothetical protein